MNATYGFWRVAQWALILGLLAQPVRAQHVLVTENDGQIQQVFAANGTEPCVQYEGKVISIGSHSFALREVPEFAPYFVAVSNVKVRTEYLMNEKGGGKFNNVFHLNADFETDYRLKDVFVVLSMNTQEAGKRLFLWGVGTLEPNQKKSVAIMLPMATSIGSARYDFHLFSGGAELLQSLLPIGQCEIAVNRMVASRIKDVHNAAPKFFFGPDPVYPPSLKKTNLKGQAVVNVRIVANGEVSDPVVKSATDPAFGEAALRAVRLWRFLPRVRDDFPVETKVDIPVVFDPRT